MLNWCSYCQCFIGESPDYDALNVTHGICGKCSAAGAVDSDKLISHARLLARIQDDLREAGERRDLDLAKSRIAEAVRQNVRPADILVGVMGPLLYDIGERWRRGEVSIQQEHQFTSFYERVYEAVAHGATQVSLTRGAITAPAEAMIVNAPGNMHSLGSKILALWLAAEGISTKLFDDPPGASRLTGEIARSRPKWLLISVSMPEQRTQVVEILQHLAVLAPEIRPTVLVGGGAVKRGLIAPASGATLVVDLRLLGSILTASESNAVAH